MISVCSNCLESLNFKLEAVFVWGCFRVGNKEKMGVG